MPQPIVVQYTLWEVSLKGRRKYIFTNKKDSIKGIMGTILGVISLVSVVLAVYLSYRQGGNAGRNCGAAVLLALLFSLTGEVLGVMSKMEQDTFYLFSYLSIGLNAVVLAGISFILYAGAYGL